MNELKDKLKMLNRTLFGSWSPRTRREQSDAVGFNFLMHWFPAKITNKSASWGYSFWLGTISASLFLILSLTGIILMMLYVPSVERAYHSIKDLEFVVSYGWFIRRMHRWAAHLMVAAVYLHMFRVFLTAAYRSTSMTKRGMRGLNWIIGMVLLLLTMLLSYTGYLLPWDQLALWAITIGANIADAAPIIGPKIKFFMQGGTLIGQNTLILWYTMHVAILPLLVVVLLSWHMWRIRKDGGLASVDSLGVEKTEERDHGKMPPRKTYTLMGVVEGIRPSVIYNKVMGESSPAIPGILIRVMIVFLFTLSFNMFLSVFFNIPLEEPATTEWTPNPAKAPWYFLWLQELVTITTIRIGGMSLNGGFIGGIIIPGIIGTIAAIWPFLDKSPESSVGVWFHKTRKVQNTVFLVIIGIILVMTFIGTNLRGPNWEIYMPWEDWPEHPHKF
jgi:quinol-cytochrome oxidoreductase complex cytochrome b subunit